MVKIKAGIYIFVFLLSLSISNRVLSQETQKSEKKEARKAKKQDKIDNGKPMLLPLIGPAYTPEMKFTIAGGFMLSYKTNPKDTLIQRSSSPLNIGVSWKNRSN